MQKPSGGVSKGVVIRISPKGKQKRCRKESLDKPLIEEGFQKSRDGERGFDVERYNKDDVPVGQGGKSSKHGDNVKNVEMGGVEGVVT